MSRFVMSYEPDKFKIREFLEKLQGKNAIDIVMKSIDYAEVQLEKAIIDIDIYIYLTKKIRHHVRSQGLKICTSIREHKKRKLPTTTITK